MTDLSTRELVERFSRPVDAFIQAADRTRYESSLFDMRRRTLLGQYCLADYLVWFLQQVADRMPPAELAHSLRRLASVPYGQLIHAMPWSYLVPRENDIALGRWPRGDGLDDEALAWLMAFWEEMSVAYYASDGLVLPSEAGDTQRFLPEHDQETVRALLDDAPREIDEAQRIVARLEMLNFVISGEIRGRNYYHGPYPSSAPDAFVVVQEFTELRHRHQPWVQELLGFELDNVVCIRELSGIDLAFDLFGFMVVVGGGSYRSHIRRAALATVEDGVARPLRDAELERLTADVRRAIAGAYATFATWDDDFRIGYGVERSAIDRLPDVRAMGDVAPVWVHWREGRGFTPPA
jgi:hypothetical protein